MTTNRTRKIVDKLRDAHIDNGKRYTFYLDEKIVEAFRKLNSDISISAIINEWMKADLRAAERKRAKKK